LQGVDQRRSAKGLGRAYVFFLAGFTKRKARRSLLPRILSKTFFGVRIFGVG
jgi:hypothetical protein